MATEANQEKPCSFQKNVRKRGTKQDRDIFTIPAPLQETLGKKSRPSVSSVSGAVVWSLWAEFYHSLSKEQVASLPQHKDCGSGLFFMVVTSWLSPPLLIRHCRCRDYGQTTAAFIAKRQPLCTSPWCRGRNTGFHPYSTIVRQHTSPLHRNYGWSTAFQHHPAVTRQQPLSVPPRE